MKAIYMVIFAVIVIAVAGNYCETDGDCGLKLSKCKTDSVICRCKKSFCTAKKKCKSDPDCPFMNTCIHDNVENTTVCRRKFQGFNG
ncbi:unnamed protein product, partial [Mesorhabditis belari]|uniref:Uncharacterized protein n=1 Tax=Mesorhabditis belari TaxID=2138241 RepID=A0AAF3FJJ8_9BILA